MAVRLTGASAAWVLPEGETILGRGDGSGVRIDDPRLSRHHARLLVEGLQVRVVDLGSANGVLVNGDRIAAPTALRAGDIIVCGPVRLEVETDGERAPAQVKGDGTTGTLRALVGDSQPQRSTEQMAQEEIQRALAEASAGRPVARLDPAIAAALIGAPKQEGSTSIRPSEMLPVSSTTALSPNRFHEPSALPDEPRRTTSILPNDAPEVGTAALIADAGHGRPSPRARLLAGAGDPLLALVLGALLGGALALAGTVGALAWSGAGVVDGRFAIPGTPAAAPAELLQACLTVRAVGGLGDLARQLHAQPEMGPFLLLFLSWAVGAVTLELTLLLRLVAATVGRGGPALHRRCGLVIAVRRNGHHPGWVRALWRWTVLGLTAPIALATAACGVRGLHDLLSACEVRKR